MEVADCIMLYEPLELRKNHRTREIERAKLSSIYLFAGKCVYNILRGKLRFFFISLFILFFTEFSFCYIGNLLYFYFLGGRNPII